MSDLFTALSTTARALDAQRFGLDVVERHENSVAHVKKHIDDFAATYGKLITELGIKAE